MSRMNAEPNSIDVWEAFLDPQGDYSLPDFTAVTPEALLTAVHTATDFARAEVAAIIADEAESTFFSTTVRFESASVPMTRIASVAAAVESNHLRPELADAIAEVWEVLSATRTEILLDVDLFHRIEQVSVTDLNPEDKRQQELTVELFVRAGARLGEEGREQMATIAAELTTLENSFSRALQLDTRELAVHLGEVEALAGMNEDQIAAAATRANERGVDGYLLPLNNFTQQIVLESLNTAQTRRHVLNNSMARGSRGGDGEHPHPRSLTPRRCAPCRRTCSDTPRIRRSPSTIRPQATPMPPRTSSLPSSMPRMPNSMRSSRRSRTATASKPSQPRTSSTIWRSSGPMNSASTPYEVAKYSEFDTVLTEGSSAQAATWSRRPASTFAPYDGVRAWHEDVRAFEVTDTTERPLGLVLIDPYTRDTKRGGPGWTELVPASRLTGLLPVVTLSLNLAKPGQGRPTLLNPTELTTFFHEFGHVLHGLFRELDIPVDGGYRGTARLCRVPLPAQRDVALPPAGPPPLRRARRHG